MDNTWYVFDFDSTFTQVEAMEELASISLENDPEREVLIDKIKQLTDLAMEGKMPFSKSLKARIALLSAKKYHLNMLVNRLRKRVSPSFSRNKAFFKANKGRVIIISGGFKEFIIPVVKPYFIDAEQVYANTFVFDKKNNIIGADESNYLAQENGKVKLLKALKLSGKVVMVGDGYTDFQVYEAGEAHKFYAYTENISRAKVVSLAPLVAPSLDEILYQHKAPMALSYPRTRIKALLWGEATWEAEGRLKQEGYQIKKLASNVGLDTLKEAYSGSNIFLFDPQNPRLSKHLAACYQLPNQPLAAGIWGELTDNHIIDPLALKGCAVFGSAYAHTRSVAELALLYLLQLLRNKGEELLGKRLGLLGYGHSGSLISVLAAHLGMEVYYYDVADKPALGNAKRVKQVSDIFRKCELIVNVAGLRFKDNFIIDEKAIRQMPQGAILVHLGYDETLVWEAAASALKAGKLGGFGADSLLKDYSSHFKGMANAILSFRRRLETKQTQQLIAEGLSERVLKYINTGNTQGSINMPVLHLPELQNSHRFIHIHRNEPGVLAQINSILAGYKINVTGQYLKTEEKVGFVITDVSKEYPEQTLKDLRAIKETIRFRVLY